MAKTPTDRLVEFSAILATFDVRLGHCDQRLADLLEDHKDGSETVNDRCKLYELEISHLKRDIEELKHWKQSVEDEQKDNKKWYRSFGPNVVAALLTIVLAPLSVVAWNWLTAR